MALVKLENGGRQFATEPIWQGVNLQIEPNERLGLIGVNGCGKSSLLRVLGRLDPLDYGQIAFQRDLTVGYLPQTPEFEPGLSVRDTVYNSQRSTLDALREYERLCELYAKDPTPKNGARLDELNSRLSSLRAWELPQRIESLLSQLQLDKNPHPIEELSQGGRKKVALAIALLNNPQLLLLDEPTNHLDTLTIDWLENQLRLFPGALVVVTHDRYFLDRVSARILELDKGRAQIYVGGYSAYLERKEEEQLRGQAETERRANLIRQEMEWFKRGARARSTKQKARQERLFQLLELQESQKQLLNRPQEVKLGQLPGNKRLGSKGLKLVDISKSFGNQLLFKGVDLTLGRGERIGLVGPNGCGKSTFLNILAERLAPDSGHLEVGETVQRGYYSQNFHLEDSDQTILDYVRERGEYIVAPNGKRVSAESMLEQFLFPRPRQQTLIRKLSGGERKRLQLLALLMQSPNCLFLDEPTNDLDIPTLMRLESWLDDFAGIVVIVSHDRYFLDRCVDRLFYFEKGTIREFQGDYEVLREHLNREAQREIAAQAPPPTKVEKAPTKAAAPPKKRKLTFKEQRRLQELERLISEGEERLAQVEAKLASPSSDRAEMESIYKEAELLPRQLEEYYGQWEELASLA